MSIPDPAHPEPVEGPEPGTYRALPDFLKSGDPALTFPLGKTLSRNHPEASPAAPTPPTPKPPPTTSPANGSIIWRRGGLGLADKCTVTAIRIGMIGRQD